PGRQARPAGVGGRQFAAVAGGEHHRQAVGGEDGQDHARRGGHGRIGLGLVGDQGRARGDRYANASGHAPTPTLPRTRGRGQAGGGCEPATPVFPRTRGRRQTGGGREPATPVFPRTRGRRQTGG